MCNREHRCGIVWTEIFKKRFLSISVPYFCFCSLLMIFFCCMQIIAGESVRIIEYCIQLFSLQGICALWFLPCYVVAEMMLAMIVQYHKGLILIPICLFLYLFYGLDDCGMFVSTFIRMLLGCIIAYIGYWIQRLYVIEKVSIAVAIILLGIGTLLSQIEGRTAMHSLCLGNIGLYFSTFVIMSMAILSIFKYWDELQDMDRGWLRRWLNLFGTNTIVVLCTHNIFLEVLRLLDYKLTGSTIRDAGLIGSIPLTVLILLIELPIIYIANTRIGFLFGKKVTCSNK